jgi:hypothetical protein
MKINTHFRFIVLLLVFTCNKVNAQEKIYTPIVIGETLKTNFAFTRNWAYPWYMTRDKKGNLHKNTEGKITKSDKAHLYFTANCKTDVQGGYSIRYCYANKLSDTLITLDFRDGGPAYFASFKASMKNGKFCFEPKIITPVFDLDQEISYKTIRQNLTLNQKEYQNAKLISGYIDVAFSEIIKRGGKSTERHLYHLRGYFKTPLN